MLKCDGHTYNCTDNRDSRSSDLDFSKSYLFIYPLSIYVHTKIIGIIHKGRHFKGRGWISWQWGVVGVKLLEIWDDIIYRWLFTFFSWSVGQFGWNIGSVLWNECFEYDWNFLLDKKNNLWPHCTCSIEEGKESNFVVCDDQIDFIICNKMSKKVMFKPWTFHNFFNVSRWLFAIFHHFFEFDRRMIYLRILMVYFVSTYWSQSFNYFTLWNNFEM